MSEKPEPKEIEALRQAGVGDDEIARKRGRYIRGTLPYDREVHFALLKTGRPYLCTYMTVGRHTSTENKERHDD